MSQMTFENPAAERAWAEKVWLEAAPPIRASAGAAEPTPAEPKPEQQTIMAARMVKAAEVFIGTELYSDDGAERILDIAFRDGLTVQQATHEIMGAFTWLANGHGGIPAPEQAPN